MDASLEVNVLGLARLTQGGEDGSGLVGEEAKFAGDGCVAGFCRPELLLEMIPKLGFCGGREVERGKVVGLGQGVETIALGCHTLRQTLEPHSEAEITLEVPGSKELRGEQVNGGGCEGATQQGLGELGNLVGTAGEGQGGAGGGDGIEAQRDLGKDGEGTKGTTQELHEVIARHIFDDATTCFGPVAIGTHKGDP